MGKSFSQDFGDLEFSYSIGTNKMSYYDDSAGGGGVLNEEEVRRLHSFLSQWLEANQKDHF